MLCVIDEFSRECLAIRVERRLNAQIVLEVLADLFLEHGPPEHIRSDNVLCRVEGTEIGRAASFADERQRCEDRPSGFRRQWMALSTIANTRSAFGAAFTVLNKRCGSERKA